MNYPDFSGKVVSFSLTCDNYNHDLMNPVIEEQVGRLFVVGEIPVGATSTGWTDGKRAAFAWENVFEYTIFDNFSDYTTSINQAGKEGE